MIGCAPSGRRQKSIITNITTYIMSTGSGGRSPVVVRQTTSLDQTAPQNKIESTDVIPQVKQSNQDSDDFVPCSDHEHFDIPIVDEVIDINVDQIFEMVFTNHPFYRHFQNVKKTSRMEISEWSEPDARGEKGRTIDYTIAIAQNIGPKSADTHEKQYVREFTKPGSCYIIDSDCFTTGIPYGESFYLVNRFCINRLGKNTSQLRITSKIIYTKKVWGLIKNFIDKNVKSGTVDSYVLLAKLLNEYKDRSINVPPTPPPKDSPVVQKKKLKKRRQLHRVSKQSQHSTSEQQRSQNSGKNTIKQQMINKYMNNIDTFAIGVLILLFVLSVLNIVLFYTLSNLEEKTTQLRRIRTLYSELTT